MAREVWAFPTSITLRLTWPLSWTMLEPLTGTVSLQEQTDDQDQGLCRAQWRPTLAALPVRATDARPGRCADRHSLLRRMPLGSAYRPQRLGQYPVSVRAGARDHRPGCRRWRSGRQVQGRRYGRGRLHGGQLPALLALC